MDTFTAFMTYAFPVIALVLSVAFWLQARASAAKAETLLDQLDRNARGWQSDIMSSATNLLNASPEIVGTKIYLAKLEGAAAIAESVKLLAEEVTKNPKSGAEAESQQKTLKMLLDYQFHFVNTLIDGRPLPSKPSPPTMPPSSGGGES